MRKTRQQVIDELFELKKGLYSSIGELKHSVRSIFNNNTLMVTRIIVRKPTTLVVGVRQNSIIRRCR